MAECLHCGEELKWDGWRGWVHQEGGLYVQYCKWCGWRGAPYPSRTVCPVCQATDLRDDHCALPKAAEEIKGR